MAKASLHFKNSRFFLQSTNIDNTEARDKAAEAITKSLLVQLETGRTLLGATKRSNLLDPDRARCIQSAKRIVEFAESKLWKSPLKPADVIRVSAEVERLRFEIDSLS